MSMRGRAGDSKLKDNAKMGPIQELLGHPITVDQFRHLLALCAAALLQADRF